VRAEEVLAALGQARAGWIALALASVLLVALTKAARWQALLKAGGRAAHAERVPFRPVFEVLLIAQMFNIVLPIRIGEIVRILLLNRLGGPSKGAILSTIAVEKLLDLLFTSMIAVLVLPLAVTAVSFQESATVSLSIALAAVVVLAVAGRWHREILAWGTAHLLPYVPQTLRRPMIRVLDVMLVTLQVLSDPRALATVVGWSLLVWCFSLLSFYLLFWALQLEVAPAAGVVLFVALQLVPTSTPGMIGVPNALARGVLPTFFGVSDASAVAYGLLAYPVLIGPPVLLGAFFLGQRAAQLPAWRSLLGLASWPRAAEPAAEPAPGRTAQHEHDAAFFDRVWRERAAREGDLVIPPDDVMVCQDLGRSLAYVFEVLGDLRGQRVLELGCGVGDYTVLWARRGAQVLATDISPESIDITRRRAAANGLAHAIEARCLPAEALAVPDASCDLVIGFGVLHHLEDLERVGREVRRVLRPGGRALFREPLGGNPLLDFARRYVPYRDKHRTPFEHPLTFADVAAVGHSFGTAHVRAFYLFSMITRAWGHEQAFPWLWALDEALLRHWPQLGKWARYVVVVYED
jgi:uncharacterized protein (TIRG00374 family)